MTLHFYWTYLETQKGPNYWYEQSFYCAREMDGGTLGQKPVAIVTDAFLLLVYLTVHDSLQTNFISVPQFNNTKTFFFKTKH